MFAKKSEGKFRLIRLVLVKYSRKKRVRILFIYHTYFTVKMLKLYIFKIP